MGEPGAVLVYGAGAIGQFLAGALASAGVAVHCVARPHVVKALRERGLQFGRIDGRTVHLAPGVLGASESLEQAPPPSLVLLTVKGPATTAAGAELQRALPAGTLVVSFQNGVDNPARLRDAAPGLHVLAGMVPFNVVMVEPGVVRQSTDGQLACASDPAIETWASAFARAGLPLALHADMRAVQWGKLLLNLNNPVNAAAGIPLREQLLQRGYRQVVAALQAEALGLLRRAGIRPARVTPMPPALLPALLRLPTPLFQALAQRMLTISPEARSSMQDDRDAGRPTEIDELCGAVVRLAASTGDRAPLNERMLELIPELEPGERLAPKALQARLGLDGSP
ncbi:2-dehydropantoate 2-reductase [Pseudomarimonas salicorniae]|uniref:2-dehydropantoate 2-reductase n=1 Tax=Pseudomarimonas salicorniae TaxID=2933270 RepID=A0ABT0GHM3_9GAMM|nr:2-dehydropantoate 2-reductase [Lysobacter sp. CAU 1642]MCK7594038.1 2-dehydropantoate 2-reductase [Lysobacter sp. CAU 1642]